jgi:cytochrome c553
MSKRLFPALMILLVVTGLSVICLNTAAVGGGWALVTLDEWPTQVIANQPFTIGYSLRQHGLHLLSYESGSVQFEQGEHETNRLQFRALPTLTEGHYKATITLPAAGLWQWRIGAWGPHAMPPLRVNAAPPAPGQAFELEQPAMLGRALFVAKGCSSCHGLPGDPSHHGFAPSLSNLGLSAAYLRLWLSDPKALKPGTLMPNLGLKPGEIEALTAFLIPEQK